MGSEVRYFLGRTGSGKSHRMMEEIVADLHSGEQYPLILLVPEQFTLQAERDLIEKMDLPGIMRVEILSLTRLAYRVFNEVGGLTKTTINEQGKSMIIRKIINENAELLTIYKKAARQTGLVDKVSSLLAAFKQQGISPEDLEQAGNVINESSTAMKVKDIALLYQKFNQYLQGRYLDTEDRVNLFIAKLEESSFLKEARIWIDGFTTYSRQSLNIIQKIMCQARQTTISFTLHNEGDYDSDLFWLSVQSYRQIRAIARQCGIAEEVVEFEGTGLNGKQPQLQFLEKELYAYPYRIHQDKCDNIQLFAAANTQSEVEKAAHEVIKLAREQGCRWKDIAVVCNSMDTYGEVLNRTFTQYGIPFFMDMKRSILTNPLIQLIIAALEVLEYDFRTEDVARLMKTGLISISADTCERLENYALQYGLAGAKWRTPLTRGDEQVRQELEPWREVVVRPLMDLGQKTRGTASCSQINRAIYEFLARLEVERKLSEWIDSLNQEGEYALASENAQIWNIVLDILDQMDEFMGDQDMTLKDYHRVLEAGFQSYEVGIIPTTVDQVLVGDIQRSKSHDIKALLLLGANDGILPSSQEKEELLSAEEKEQLQEKGLDLGYDREKRALEERFLIYSALGKPSDYLFVSWSLADRDGRAVRPSILVDRFMKLFPGLRIKSDITCPNPENEIINTPASTFVYMINGFRDMADHKPVSNCWWDVYSWYYDHSEWQDLREMMIKGLMHTNQTEHIDRPKAVDLYGSRLYPSVSRLEKYAACPFAHFVCYGLTPRERKMYTVEWPDMGEMLHKSLFLFADALKSKGLQWNNLAQPACEEIIDGVMDNIIEEYGEGVFSSTHRYRYLGRRLKRIGRRAAWTLTQHLQQGDFTPAEFEVRFGRGGKFPPVLVELGNGEQIFLEGRIDRVDYWETDDSVYTRVIDYKTGDKKLDLSDVYYGLSLQLLVYLQAVLSARSNEGRPVKPGGIFYFKIDDPIINVETIKASVEKALARELRMRGVVLKDVSVAQHMDHDLGSSDVIPASLTREGEFTRYSSVLAEAEFMALLQHVRGLIRTMGSEILEGRVAIDPVSKDGKTACANCPYWSICQFDRLLPDNNFRSLKSPGEQDIITRVLKEALSCGDVD